MGVIWLNGVPDICSQKTITRATGGVPDPFNVWKQETYSRTRQAIIDRSRSDWVEDYIDTLDQVIIEHNDDMFEFAVKPDESIGGFANLYYNGK